MFIALILALVMQTAPPASAPPTAAQLTEVYTLFVEGQALADAGDAAGAIAKYKKALDVLPGSADVRAELAETYAESGDVANAEVEATRALETDSANRAANRLLGLIIATRAARAGGEDATTFTRRATTYLERSNAVAIRDLAVMLTLGELYVRAENFPRAIAILEEFLVDRPGYPQAMMLLAEAYRRTGRADEARDLVAGFEGMGANSAEARRRQAVALSTRGEWAAAAAAWARVVSDDPRDSSARLQYAVALVNANDLATARTQLTALTRDDPKEIGGWQMLALVELRAGRLQLAEDAAKRIDAIDPTDFRGPLTVAAIRDAQKDYKGVVAVLDRRVSSPLPADIASGAFAEMATRLADAWHEIGNDKRAVATLEGAHSRLPDDLNIAFSLASTYERTRAFDKAEKTFREVIESDPEHAGALNYLGYMLADRGKKLPEALKLIERALAIEPDNAAYLDSLGWAYFKLGRYSDAVGPLERAAAGAAKSSVIQDHLGDAYLKLGRHAEAADAYERALGGDRDGIDAERITKKRDQARASAKR
jgi:tetratricopeptide (TPR) repeat protein